MSWCSPAVLRRATTWRFVDWPIGSVCHGKHVVSVVTEHRAVLDPLQRLQRRGLRVQLLPVHSQDSPQAGRLDPQQVADAIQPDTMLVSVMLANNEIGVVQPLAEIAEICAARGVLLHCDATQAVGKIPLDVRQAAASAPI